MTAPKPNSLKPFNSIQKILSLLKCTRIDDCDSVFYNNRYDINCVSIASESCRLDVNCFR